MEKSFHCVITLYGTRAAAARTRLGRLFASPVHCHASYSMVVTPNLGVDMRGMYIGVRQEAIKELKMDAGAVVTSYTVVENVIPNPEPPEPHAPVEELTGGVPSVTGPAGEEAQRALLWARQAGLPGVGPANDAEDRG